MANIVVTSDDLFQAWNAFLNINRSSITLVSPELVTIRLGEDQHVRFEGTDLDIDTDLINPWVAGTVSEISIISTGGETLVSITDLSVSAAELGALLGADEADFEYSLNVIRFLLSGDDTYLGSDGSNPDVVYTGMGDDSISTGAGNDHIYSGPGAATIDGGEGSDSIYFNEDFLGYPAASGGITVNLTTGIGTNTEGETLLVSGVEIVYGSLGNDVIIGNGADNFLFGNEGNDSLSGGAGNDIMYGGGGKDTLRGGEGDDHFMIGESDMFGEMYPGDVFIDGGAGNDMADLNGDLSDYSFNFVDKDTLVFTHKASGVRTTVTGVETIYDGLVYRTMDDFRPVSSVNNAPGSISLTSGWVWENTNGNKPVGVLNAKDSDGDILTFSLVDDAGGRFRIDGNKLVVADGTTLDYEQAKSHTVTVQVSDGRGGSSNQSFTIAVRDVAKETVTGGSASDTVKGGSGSDKIGGGLGKDVLTGGKGKDTFVFNTKASKTNVDKITDFSVKDDTIQLENQIFTKLTKAGALKNDFFTIGIKAKDKNDYIVYNNKKGVLYYDTDGSGKGKAVEIATLSKNLKMTAADFFVI